MAECHSTQEHWRNHIQAWQESRLSQKAFCAMQELRYSTFCYWRRKLSCETHPQSILPLQLLPDQIGTARSTIELKHPGGLCLTVGPDFDPETLIRLLKVLDRVS